MLGKRLISLRKLNRYSLNDVAKFLGVTRQAIAKWEKDESTPDLLTAKKLANIYRISLDELINCEEQSEEPSSFAKDLYIFETVSVNLNGEISIPKDALEIFQIKPGDEFLFLGDLERGFELIYTDYFWKSIQKNEEDPL
jgi:transcriptional regulator with XRE-family HTH domain